MGETRPRLDILCHRIQTLAPRMGYSLLSRGLKWLYDPRKHHRLSPRLLTTLCNLMVKLLLETPWLKVIEQEELDWCSSKSLTSTD